MKKQNTPSSKLPLLTLSIIRTWTPCYDPIRWYPETWSGTAQTILKDDRIPAGDRLWCVLRVDAGTDEKTQRLFACWCAREALKLIPEKEIDPRSIKAIEVSENFAYGKATKEELAAARDAARDAAWDAAWTATRAAAKDAARDASWDAARAAAWAAARDAARPAAWAAARDAQVLQLISMLPA